MCVKRINIENSFVQSRLEWRTAVELSEFERGRYPCCCRWMPHFDINFYEFWSVGTHSLGEIYVNLQARYVHLDRRRINDYSLSGHLFYFKHKSVTQTVVQVGRYWEWGTGSQAFFESQIKCRRQRPGPEPSQKILIWRRLRSQVSARVCNWVHGGKSKSSVTATDFYLSELEGGLHPCCGCRVLHFEIHLDDLFRLRTYSRGKIYVHLHLDCV